MILTRTWAGNYDLMIDDMKVGTVYKDGYVSFKEMLEALTGKEAVEIEL